MDFGLMGLDGLVAGSDTPTATTKASSLISIASDPESKQKWYGSGFLKQERACTTNEDDLRCSKLAKIEDFSASSKSMRNSSIFPDVQQNQQMLSFSSPKMEDKCSPNVTFPYFHLTPPPFSRNPGYSNGVFPGANVHGVFSGTRGPFTPSQWMELEQQALIYKYMTANMPIPAHMLFPIRKAYDSVDFSGFPGGYFRPNAFGWGTFHVGFGNSTDPEPGRCRRTDGKKWRCARDAVVDQKYCERHMNRGRHRSRKPVEGLSGHSAAVTNKNSKLMPPASSSTVVGPNSGGGASSSLTIAQQQQIGTYQAAPASNLSTTAPLNRNPFEEAARNDFGVVSTDSLLNPSHKGSSLINCRNLGSSQETDSQHSFRQFMDDWPKDVQSERTQLSISIPLPASDFMSSTSSPNNEKVTLSPLRLSREFDPIQMGLGVGTVINEPNHRQTQTNWIPVSWENSMGGPLGEVLHSTSNNSTVDCKNSSPLNLMTEGWDHSSSLGSSPTGVLQKTAFGSLSNSSAGSSPRMENNRIHEGGSICNDLRRGSTVVHSSLPAI